MGRHSTPRRKLPASPEQWEAWERAASAAGLPVSQWLARVADLAARKARPAAWRPVLRDGSPGPEYDSREQAELTSRALGGPGEAVRA